jgi:hypothetical protein
MSEQEQEAIGVAKGVVQVLFPALASSNFPAIIQFYGENAVILFQSDEAVGRKAIWDYLKAGFANVQIKQLRVNGCEAQPIPDSDLSIMIVVVGVVQFQTDKVASFHSVLYLDADPASHTAFVTYHSLNFIE